MLLTLIDWVILILIGKNALLKPQSFKHLNVLLMLLKSEILGLFGSLSGYFVLTLDLFFNKFLVVFIRVKVLRGVATVLKE